MLETLYGRLKWKPTPWGMVVIIPARRGAMMHLYGPLVGFWLIAAGVHYWRLLVSPRMQYVEYNLQMIAIGVYVLGFLFAACWLVWTFTKESAILLNPVEMRVQRLVMGIEVSSRNFSTEDVRGLRFVPPVTSWASQGEPDPKTSKIEFRIGDQKLTFAEGITEKEALALFAAMQRVYHFPDYGYPNLDFAKFNY
jgi:hypothetical protein